MRFPGHRFGEATISAPSAVDHQDAVVDGGGGGFTFEIATEVELAKVAEGAVLSSAPGRTSPSLTLGKVYQ